MDVFVNLLEKKNRSKLCKLCFPIVAIKDYFEENNIFLNGKDPFSKRHDSRMTVAMWRDEQFESWREGANTASLQT